MLDPPKKQFAHLLSGSVFTVTRTKHSDIVVYWWQFGKRGYLLVQGIALLLKEPHHCFAFVKDVVDNRIPLTIPLIFFDDQSPDETRAASDARPCLIHGVREICAGPLLLSAMHHVSQLPGVFVDMDGDITFPLLGHLCLQGKEIVASSGITSLTRWYGIGMRLWRT